MHLVDTTMDEEQTKPVEEKEDAATTDEIPRV